MKGPSKNRKTDVTGLETLFIQAKILSVFPVSSENKVKQFLKISLMIAFHSFLLGYGIYDAISEY